MRGLLLAEHIIFGAVGADAAHQSLCHDPDEGARQEEGKDVEIQQTSHGSCGLAGVDRAEDLVTGQGCLDCILSGFRIADLADHHHVRVLTEHRLEHVPNVSPIRGCMAIWLNFSWTFSIGSSSVTMLILGLERYASEL